MGLAMIDVSSAARISARPSGKSQDAEMAGDRPQPAGLGTTESSREIIEHAVHVHHQRIRLNLTDPRPFGVPSVAGIVGVRGLGQAERVPCAAVQQFENHRTPVPADAPQRVSSSGAVEIPPGPVTPINCLALHDPPSAVPLGQHARLLQALRLLAHQVLQSSGLMLSRSPLLAMTTRDWEA